MSECVLLWQRSSLKLLTNKWHFCKYVALVSLLPHVCATRVRATRTGDFDVACLSAPPAFATCHFYGPTFFRYEHKNVWENYCPTFLAIFLSFGCRYVIANLRKGVREKEAEKVCYVIRLGKSFKCRIYRSSPIQQGRRYSFSTFHLLPSCLPSLIRFGLVRFGSVFVVVFLKFRFRLKKCAAHMCSSVFINY